MFRKIIGLGLGLAATVCSLYGGSVHVELAAGLWNQSPSGWVRFPDDAILARPEIDVESDLGMDDSNTFYLRGRIEHPVPILPNVRLELVDTDYSGANTLDSTIVFGKTRFSAGSSIESSLKLTSADATFYYNLLDARIKADVGLSVRYLDGKVAIVEMSSALGESKSFTAVLPLLYMNARVPIPIFEGLSAGAEGAWFSYDGNEVADLKLDIRYLFAMGLGLEVGYRYQSYTLDDLSSLSGEIDQNGIFFGAVWAF